MTQDTNHLRLIACPSVFSLERNRIDMMCRPPGTITDLMHSIDWAREAIHTRVFLDGILIEHAAWEYTMPKAGQSVVVRAIPTGGQSGKDWGRMAAMIAVMGAAIAMMQPQLGVGALLAGGMGFGTAGAWGLGASIATSILGTLAVTGTIPPPLPRPQVTHG